VYCAAFARVTSLLGVIIGNKCAHPYIQSREILAIAFSLAPSLVSSLWRPSRASLMTAVSHRVFHPNLKIQVPPSSRTRPFICLQPPGNLAQPMFHEHAPRSKFNQTSKRLPAPAEARPRIAIRGFGTGALPVPPCVLCLRQHHLILLSFSSRTFSLFCQRKRERERDYILSFLLSSACPSFPLVDGAGVAAGRGEDRLSGN